MHNFGIIHRDLKCANVLVTHDGTVRLSDFGSSKRFENIDEFYTKSLKGSPYWMAPEVVRREGHTFSADIWSVGCVIIEMLTGLPPWSNYSRNAKEVLNLIATPDNLPDIPECSPSLRSLIKRCLRRIPNERPNIGDLLMSEFI